MNESKTAPVRLIGTIDKLIFNNKENGYTVFLVTIEKQQAVTVSGILPHVTAGQEVELIGSWVMHKKFGRQFCITQCIQKIPVSITGLKRYLGSGLIKGIGASYAEKLVDHFGSTILTVIEQQPHRLQEVIGIGEKRAELITQSFTENKDISHIMIFLQTYGISPAYAAKIYKQYRTKTIDILKENPYRLAEEVWGIGFKLADEIAQKMGFATDSPQRKYAGIIYALQVNSQSGNLYIEKNNLLVKASDLLKIPDDALDDSLKYGIEQEKIKTITLKETVYYALATHYHAEQAVSKKLRDLLEYVCHPLIESEKAHTALMNPKAGSLCLNEDQQKSIMAILQQKVTIITGGPGTGKTTLIRTLLLLLEEEKIVYKLAAPTGRAAKRISEQTGRYATTIHRLLEIDPQTYTFVHNESNALKIQILIIDESSMIDIFLAHALLKALPLYATIVFLGDIDQLPSVGPGNFLADCLASSVIPRIRLTHIFRQAENSLITLNAHRIITGQSLLRFSPEARNDFIFIKEDDPEHLFDHIINCYSQTLKTHGINNDHTIILTPMNRGIVGNISLNHTMQSFLNSGQKVSITHGTTTFKVDDRVMQVRNNYEKIVFNGDCGIVKDIDHQDEKLSVLFQDKVITYEFGELQELILAYSMTIHKSQGSEYEAVIIPLFMQHYTLLARNLIYTAVTRAKKLCIIIGQPKALYGALSQVNESKRITFLTHYLETPL